MGGLDLIGKVLDGRYRVESRLGAGGMATVYLARQETLKRHVVVKVPDPVLLQDKDFRARFDIEISSMVRLRHAHIVTVYEAGEIDGTPYTVLEYLEGGSLKDRFQERSDEGRGETPAEVLDWLPRIADALDFIHGREVVHRDVKPANILFDTEGYPFLSDFGIAKALGGVDTNITRPGSTPGTPVYMAPEAGADAPLTGAADQYALGVIVYEALTGDVPHSGDTPMAVMLKKLTEPPRPLAKAAPGLCPDLSDAVMRALARQPKDRHPSCTAFAKVFGDAVTGSTEAAPVEDAVEIIASTLPAGAAGAGGTEICPDTVVAPKHRSVAPRGPRRGARVPAIAALALLLLAGGYLLLSGQWASPDIRMVLYRSPETGGLVREREAVFAGRVEGPGRLMLGDTKVEAASDGTFSISTKLAEGPNTLVLRCIDPDGDEVERLECTVTLDATPPVVTLNSLPEMTDDTTVKVSGTVSEDGCSVSVNKRAAPVTEGRFAVDVGLGWGRNPITVTARDRAGHLSTARTAVRRNQTLDAIRSRLCEQLDWAPTQPEKNTAGLWRLTNVETGLVFVLIPAGKFQMGSPETELGRAANEHLHGVTIRSPFLLSETECTQWAWEKGGGKNTSEFPGADRPVQNVSWMDCRAWCERNRLRLPTEAEWEYACRAGTETPFSFGLTITPEQVNYDGSPPYRGAAAGECRQQTVVVRSLPPNPWGLFEMHGNVLEWCEDWLGVYGEAPADGSARATKSHPAVRVFRGGHWRESAQGCRSARRLGYLPNTYENRWGFRPACSP